MMQESTTNPVNVDDEYSGRYIDNIGVTTKIPFNIFTFCNVMANEGEITVDTIRRIAERFENCGWYVEFEFDISHMLTVYDDYGKYKVIVDTDWISARWDSGMLSLKRNK